MTHRPLGRTGVKVSPLCLGAMMFGAWGNPDHDDGDPHHPRARSTPGSTSSTPPTSTRAASPRRSSARRSPAAATRSCSPPRSTARWATTRTSSATRAAGSCARSRTRCGGSKTDYIDLYQIHRPEADTDIDETLGALTDLVRQGKVRYIGSSTFPASQIVEAQWVARDRGRERFVCEQPPYSMLARGDRGRRAPDLPALRHGRDPVVAAGRRLAERQVAQGRRTRRTPHARSGCPRATTSPTPANQRKLDAADALARLADEAGHHADPDGARLRDQPPGGDRRRSSARARWSSSSRSSAPTRSRLDADLLDRIDEIVPARHDVSAADTGLAEPGAEAGGAPPLDGAGLEPADRAGGAQALDDRAGDGLGSIT